MDWLPASALAADLDALGEQFHPLIRQRMAALRAAFGDNPCITVGVALTAAFPESASEAARNRALLRLVNAVNDAAGQVGAPLQLWVAGAKQLSAERQIGFIRPAPKLTGRADMTESADLRPVLERQGEVPSRMPKVRVAVWTAAADAGLAEQLTRALRDVLEVSPGYQFMVREPHAEVLAGAVASEVHREVLAWADYLVVGLSTALLGAGKWPDHQPEILQQFLETDRCVPVLLRTLPRDCRLRCFTDRTVLVRNGAIQASALANTRVKAFEGAPAPAREAMVQNLAHQLHEWLERQPSPKPAQDARDVVDLSRGNTADLESIGQRPRLTSQATKGFHTGRTMPDVPDVATYLTTWALDPAGTSLLALLGDSGIGKTISAQRLVRALWERPGGLTAHYFDLRTISGLSAWSEIPPVHEILAACIAGGWTEGGRPIDREAARTWASDLPAETRLWPTVLVIDGLDEVLVHLSASDGQKFTNQLLRLRPTGAHPIVGKDTKVVLTCRTHYFTDVQAELAHFRDQNRSQLREEDYTALVLLPVTREQVASYLAEALRWPRKRVEDFLGSLHDLWDLGSRPFLLNQLAEVLPDLRTRSRRGETILAANVYQALVQRWLARDYGKHILSTHHKPDMMAYVAYRLWAAGSRSATVRDLGLWLQDFIRAEHLTSHYDGTSAELLANDLHTATFLIRYDEGERGLFRFAHSSMAEYFLAAWLLHCLERNHRAGWIMPVPSRETLQFLCELLATHPDKAQLLGTLAGWRAPYLSQVSELLLALGLYAAETGLVEIPLTRLDLHGADLRDLQVRGSAQRPINLSGTNLRGARLERSQLEHVVLRAADLTGTTLHRAVWNEVATSTSNTADTVATGALFRRCGPSFAPAGKAVRLIHPAAPLIPFPQPVRLSVLTGHIGGVLVVAAGPDGRIISGGSDGTVRILGSGHRRMPTHPHRPHRQRVVGRGRPGRPDHLRRQRRNRADSGIRTPANAYTPSPATPAARGRSRPARTAGSSPAAAKEPCGFWDPDTGECLHTLTGHTGSVWSVAAGPDGRIISGGSGDGTVRIWDPDTGECLHTLTGHTGSVLAVAAGPDGRIISGGEDRTVRIWDPDTGECLHTLTDHTDSVLAVAAGPDGRIISGGSDGTVRIWDPDTGECLHTLTGHTGSVWSVAAGPDGRIISGGRDDGTVRIWDPDTGECLHTLTGHTGSVLAVAAGPDGRIISGGSDGTVRIWDPDTGECLHTLTGHTGSVLAVAAGPDGRIISGGEDRTVRILGSGHRRMPTHPHRPHRQRVVGRGRPGRPDHLRRQRRNRADSGSGHRRMPTHPHRPHRQRVVGRGRPGRPDHLRRQRRRNRADLGSGHRRMPTHPHRPHRQRPRGRGRPGRPDHLRRRGPNRADSGIRTPANAYTPSPTTPTASSRSRPARTAGSSPAAATEPCGFGIRTPANAYTPSPATPAACGRSRPARTAGSSPAPASATEPRGSGIRTPATPYSQWQHQAMAGLPGRMANRDAFEPAATRGGGYESGPSMSGTGC